MMESCMKDNSEKYMYNKFDSIGADILDIAPKRTFFRVKKLRILICDLRYPLNRGNLWEYSLQTVNDWSYQ